VDAKYKVSQSLLLHDVSRRGSAFWHWLKARKVDDINGDKMQREPEVYASDINIGNTKVPTLVED